MINGQLIETDVKEIDQNTLTSDCLLIQFNGLEACSTCEFKNTKDCGGKRILKKLKQSKAKNHESTGNENIGD